MEKSHTKGVVKAAYRKESIKIAEELKYGVEVIEKLKKATTEYEISRILSDARMGVKG